MSEIQSYSTACCLKKTKSKQKKSTKKCIKVRYYILVHKICKSRNSMMPNTCDNIMRRALSYIAGGIVN